MIQPSYKSSNSRYYLLAFLLVISSILAVVLGYRGFCEYFQTLGMELTRAEIFYSTINLFFWNLYAGPLSNVDQLCALPWQLELARWLAPLTLTVAAGKAILVLMGQEINRFRLGARSRHRVIFGLNEMSIQTLKDWRKQGKRVTIVDEGRDNAYIGEAIRLGGNLIAMNPRDPSSLRVAAAQRAHQVLICTEDDNSNLSLAKNLYLLKQQQSKQREVKCAIEIRSLELAQVLYETDLIKVDHDNFSALLINRERLLARMLLQHYGPDIVLPQQGKAVAEPLVIMLAGDEDLIIQFILRLATVGHYGLPQPLQIVYVGKSASTTIAWLKREYPALSTLVVLDSIEAQFSMLQRATCLEAIHRVNPDLLYFCFANHSDQLVWVQSFNAMQLKLPLVVVNSGKRMVPTGRAFIEASENIIYADSILDCFSADHLFNLGNDQLAKAIHSDYMEKQKAEGDTLEKNSSLKPWSSLPETLKDSNRNQADHLAVKKRLIEREQGAIEIDNGKLQISDVLRNTLAKTEHDRWMAEKLLAGWQVTDGKKDTGRRLNPCLVPWSRLPQEEKQKDFDAVDGIPNLLRFFNKTN